MISKQKKQLFLVAKQIKTADASLQISQSN